MAVVVVVVLLLLLLSFSPEEEEEVVVVYAVAAFAAGASAAAPAPLISSVIIYTISLYPVVMSFIARVSMTEMGTMRKLLNFLHEPQNAIVHYDSAEAAVISQYESTRKELPLMTFGV